MKNIYAEALCKVLKQVPIHYEERKIDNDTVLTLAMPGEKIPALVFNYVLGEDGRCFIYCIMAHHVAKNKRAHVLRLLNGFNRGQKYVKFSLERPNNVSAKLEFIIPPFALRAGEEDPDALGLYLYRMLLMAYETVDGCSPGLLRLLWEKGPADEAGRG